MEGKRRQDSIRIGNPVVGMHSDGYLKSLTLTVNYCRSHPTPGDYNFGASTHALTLRGQTAITGELGADHELTAR
jgi:hypothetical protein